MIRLSNIRLPLDFDFSCLAAKTAGLLGVEFSRIASCRLSKKSVDARRKADVHFVCTIDTEVNGNEEALCKRHSFCRVVIPSTVSFPAVRVPLPPPRPIVVGMGPAGMFAALTLARGGACPLVLERGKPVEDRQKDVEKFWNGGPLNPDSNVQFGEGGAGAFSDGKLTTGVKDPRSQLVLETFVRHGGSPEILYAAKPHLGTDRLSVIVKGIREEILALGGEVLFQHTLSGLVMDGSRLRAAQVSSPDGNREFPADKLILAVGHSARDTFFMLHKRNIPMEAKAFSVGVRIEHPQAWVDQCQYGRFAGHPALPAADYKLACHLASGRGVYTFCMCPGGRVVAAASETDGVVTNGMSLFARSEPNANSALLVGVSPVDFGDEPLSGVAFQRRIETAAYSLCDGYRAPAQNGADFLSGRASVSLSGVTPSYRPGVVPTDLGLLFPDYVTQSLREGLRQFDKIMPGFAQGVLTGPETRSSSPIRLTRDKGMQSSVLGLYPCGEGAGYAGGIMSAAIDGIKCAERVLS